MAGIEIRTDEAGPPGGPYSQGIKAGNLVFLAGQAPFTPAGELVDGGFEEQARQTFDNLRAVSEAAGGSLADAVRVGVYLRDLGNFERMNEIYVEYFAASPLPARTTIPAALPGFEIEVDAVLVLGDATST